MEYFAKKVDEIFFVLIGINYLGAGIFICYILLHI